MASALSFSGFAGTSCCTSMSGTTRAIERATGGREVAPGRQPERAVASAERNDRLNGQTKNHANKKPRRASV